MNELIKVNYENDRPTISGRELHEFLEVETPFRLWFPRMCEYGFEEVKDYTPYIFVHPLNNQETTNYNLSISMAKEICMIQRTKKGKQARQYFIQLEAAWNTPEMVMSRALKMAEKKMGELRLVNTELTVQNQLLKPKAEYFDELVERNLLTNFRETAKELKIQERQFISYLLKKKYIYRNAKGQLMPYAEKNKELFEVKESYNNKTNWTGIQTLVTPKGRETFRLLINNAF